MYRFILTNSKNCAQQQIRFWPSICAGARATIVVLFTMCALALPTGAVMAQGSAHMNSATPERSVGNKHHSASSTLQGIVMQVDRSNSNDVNFTLLDRQGNTQTIHLTAKTRFAHKASAAQLSPNSFVTVKVSQNSSGVLDAQQIVIQKHNQASFDLKGLVASVYPALHQLNLALNDGTVLTISLKKGNLSQLQTGALIALKAHFTASGSLQATSFRVINAHAPHFHVKGVISNQNSQAHRMTLVSPSGASFSVVMSKTSGLRNNSSNAATLHPGEKVDVTGSIDSHGDLDEQHVSLDDDHETSLHVEGMVSAIDTIANTFSLIDEDGNVLLFHADPTLLTGLIVGNVYEVHASINPDGTLQAIDISASLGDDRGEELSLEGTVQSYDSSSGVLVLTTEEGQNFTIQVNAQTEIESDEDSSSATLAVGDAIHVKAQLNPDGSYTALKIEIQGNDSGDGGGD